MIEIDEKKRAIDVVNILNDRINWSNKNEQNISIIDIDFVYEDTTRYDYVFPEELKLYTIYKADTQCIFVAPCASEYTIKSKNCCEIYLWPSRIIYPDDCICLIEDSGEGCFKNIADAELCMHIEFVDNNSVFTIIPLIDILETSMSMVATSPSATLENIGISIPFAVTFTTFTVPFSLYTLIFILFSIK